MTKEVELVIVSLQQEMALLEKRIMELENLHQINN